MSSTTGRVAAIATITAAVLAFAYIPASADSTPILPTGSVDSRIIKDQTIQVRDLAPMTKMYLLGTPPNSITGAQVRDGSLKLEDLSPSLRKLILQGCGPH